MKKCKNLIGIRIWQLHLRVPFLFNIIIRIHLKMHNKCI
jgi:hypothetical protein